MNPEESFLESFPCLRCGEEQVTAKELAGIIILTFDSPVMPIPSPPAFLCHKCGEAVAEFIGINVSPQRRKARLS